MNKIITIIVLLAIIASMTPVFAQTIPTGAYVPADEGSARPIIKAKWEEPDSADKDHLIPGTQILPPLDWNKEIDVEYCLVATDFNGKYNVEEAWIDVYHPDGTFKYQLQLTEQPTETPQEQAAAAARVQQAYDWGLLKLNESYTVEEVKDEILENSAKLYCGTWILDYHQMCGIYTVRSYAFDAEQQISDFFNNTFEYVCMAGIELDFNSVNFGQVVQSSNKWVEGDWDFVWQTDGPACNPDEPGLPAECRKPTVKNIGNTPVYIEVEFDDMGFGESTNGWNVEFDASLKHDEDIQFPPYTPTRLPNGGVEPEPYCETDYAVLDLCDTEKISFSIHVIKVVDRDREYVGNVWVEPVPLKYPWWECGETD